MLSSKVDRLITHAAINIIKSEGIIITAGAGMGVPSGLPDFRGKEGFYKTYPSFRKQNMSFFDAANPGFFYNDPKHFWYFYGHRYNMYKQTIPHKGFEMLLDLCQGLKKNNYFVYTSNVDGHFQKAGFPADKVCEEHGSINYYQCERCNVVREMIMHYIPLNENTCEAERIPVCSSCKFQVRPNILMFGDYMFDERRTDQQGANMQKWLTLNKNTTKCIIEVGAGVSVPTVRYFGERQLIKSGSKCNLIRINPVYENQGIYGLKGEYEQIHSENIEKFELGEKKTVTLIDVIKEGGDISLSTFMWNNQLIELKMDGLEGISAISNRVMQINNGKY